MKQESIFKEVAEIPKDPVFGLVDTFRADPRPDKVDLTVGVYIEEDGTPPKVFRSVKLAEKEIQEKEVTKSYLPLDGDPEYVDLTGKFIFGNLYNQNIYGAQTVGGTAALRILGEFIKNDISDDISLSSPSWPNHAQVFNRVGLKVDSYPYWNGKNFNFGRMFDYLSQLTPSTVVLLQSACHNPTGWDLNMDEWQALSELFHVKRLIPFFDSAYQGIGRGIEADSRAIRFFVTEGHECFVAHSNAKSMGLYAERLGALFVVMQEPKLRERIKGNILSLIRTNYSNPSKHGSEIAKLLFQKPDLNRMWLEELDKIRKHIAATRIAFADKLHGKTGLSYDLIKNGNGFFTILGLTPEQVKTLRIDHAIYMTAASRVNLAALNSTNLDHVVNAIATLK